MTWKSFMKNAGIKFGKESIIEKNNKKGRFAQEPLKNELLCIFKEKNNGRN